MGRRRKVIEAKVSAMLRTFEGQKVNGRELSVSARAQKQLIAIAAASKNPDQKIENA